PSHLHKLKTVLEDWKAFGLLHAGQAIGLGILEIERNHKTAKITFSEVKSVHYIEGIQLLMEKIEAYCGRESTMLNEISVTFQGFDNEIIDIFDNKSWLLSPNH